MDTTVAYISRDKIQTYLRLGHKLVQFVRWGRFFGRPTFDWLQLESKKDQYAATLFRSLDEDALIFKNIQKFQTLNKGCVPLDAVKNPFYQGSWEAVWKWVLQYPIDAGKFIRPEDLWKIYNTLKQENGYRL